MVGLEVRTEAAAGGGGGGVGAGWDLSAEAGPGPGLGGGRSSDPGSVRRRRETRHSQGGGARRGKGEPPASPPARRLGGTRGDRPPRSHGNPPPRPTAGKGEPAGERIPAAPSSHKRQRAPGWDNGAAGLFSEREAWGRQEENLGRGDYNKRDSIPERPLPRENFFFLGCRDWEKAGWDFLCKVPARLEGCPAGPPSPVRYLRAHHRRRGGGSAAQPPTPDPLGAASRAERGGCAAAPAPAHGSRSPATLSPAPCLSFAFPAPLAFEPPPAPGVLSACQLIPFSPEGFVPPRAPARRSRSARSALGLLSAPPSRRLPRDTRCAFNHAAPLRAAAARARSAGP